jgi:hypothetical protein
MQRPQEHDSGVQKSYREAIFNGFLHETGQLA